jgi:hypothetical protein
VFDVTLLGLTSFPFEVVAGPCSFEGFGADQYCQKKEITTLKFDFIYVSTFNALIFLFAFPPASGACLNMFLLFHVLVF